MNSNELSKILLRINDLLKLYPDKDVIYILEDMIKIKTKVLKAPVNDSKQALGIDENTRKMMINDIAKDIDNLGISDIESKLNTVELFPTLEYIKYFASLVGIEVSARQSRLNLVHTILKDLDRMRINKTISSRNN